MLHRVVSVQDALRELTRQTDVKLAAAGNEIPTIPVTVIVRDESLRDVLRSLAALDGFQWRRTKAERGQKVLTLDAPRDPRYWDFLRPHTQAEADVHRAVQGFADEAAQLPTDVWQALAVDNVGVPYAGLPPAMQQSVQDGLRAQLETLAAMHFHTSISPDNLDGNHVCFKAKQDQGLTGYTLNVVSAEGGNVMMTYSRPTDPSPQADSLLSPDAVPFQVSQRQALAARFDASRAKSLKVDPRLSRSVSIKTEDTMLGFALAALADAARINIVAQVFPGAHTVSLASVPLKDALDQVGAKYRAVWGEAADGTILVHYNEYPHSPAQQTAVK